jgi:pre-mRNA-splicing helicase BRR2
MRSDADERVIVEAAMREKGLGWILRELAGDRQAAAAKSVEAMDVDGSEKERFLRLVQLHVGLLSSLNARLT